MRILGTFWDSKRGLGPIQGVRGGTGEAPRLHLVGSNHEKVIEIYKLTLQALSDKFDLYASRCGWAEKQKC